MSAFFAIVKKELRSVTRERTIIIAITIQLFIASFSSALLIGLLSFYDPESMTTFARGNLRIGILGDAKSPLVLYLRDSHMRVTPFDTSTIAENAFRDQAVDLVLYIPPDNGDAVEMKMFLPTSELRASLMMIFLREPFKRYENFLRQERGVAVNYTNVPGLPSTTFEFLYAVIVPMLMLFPAFVAGSMVIDSLSEELETYTFETLRSAPLSVNAIFGAKIFAAWIVAVIQLVVWLALLRLNRIDIQNLPLVFLLAMLIAAMNIVISASTATFLRDRERSQFIYSLFILLAVGVSTLIDVAPVQLLTRLATGDYYTGIFDVVNYAALLVVFFWVLTRTTRRVTTT
ncbi:MAG: ABC transporter permease [Chloroflexi bacterium]|nr:ABC transporter permease [Chloroflexota bacterium]